MKNGRALKGHKRIATIVGIPGPIRHAPPGGWDVGCICGWSGGHFDTSAPANQAYRAHLDYEIDHGIFRCKRCGRDKPASQMRADYRYICLECFSDLGNDWQRRHPEQSARHKRNSHLIKKFGITLAEADKLLSEQGGVCAVCLSPISDKRGYYPHVDHDHKTGKVRGLLCLSCNSGLGHFRDDPRVLRAAIEYLERTGAKE